MRKHGVRSLSRKSEQGKDCFPCVQVLSEPSERTLGIRLDQRIPTFREELGAFYAKELAGSNYFTIVYGSYAYGLNSMCSDLDMVTVCESLDAARVQRAVDFVSDFHRRHELAMDAEVPHEIKLLATFEQIEKTLAGEGFHRDNDLVVVPPVVKTKEFLESEEVALRLLLNALTGRSLFISGDRDEHEEIVIRARERLVAFMFSIESKAFFSVKSFIEALMGREERNGEMYLGYKDHPTIRKYLRLVFSQVFEQLALVRKLQKLNDGSYAVRDHGWLTSAIIGRRETQQSFFDFSSNLNPYGPPRAIDGVANNTKMFLSRYPEASAKVSLDVLSRFFKVPQNHIQVVAGSTEFFFLSPEAFHIDKGIVPIPQFWFSSSGLKRWKREVIEFPTDKADEFKINFDRLAEEIRKHEKQGKLAVYFCNPNNPTGNLHDPEEVLRLVKVFPSVTFIADETYLLFHPDYDRLTLAGQVPNHENLIVTVSLSKFFTIPGARLGCVVATPEKIRMLEAVRIPYSVNSTSLALLERLLTDRTFIQQSREQIEKERHRVTEELKKISQLKIYPLEANFVLCEICKGDTTSYDIENYLKRNGFLIRNCDGYGNLNNRFIRIAVRTREENDMLLKVIKQFFLDR